MLTLQLFGGATLLDSAGSGTGVPIQRRRLALLAALAAAPNGALSRDKLIGYFWAEEEREKARHFLADSVFSLRKSLGKDAIVNVGDDLALNRDLFECDVWRFHAALEKSEPEAAVLCYQGPFLDGFWVADASEFERWVEGERARLGRLYSAALERLAEGAATAGDLGGSVTWWKLLAAQDPLSSRIAVQLMRALAASGDRAAAIQHARVHAALLSQQLEIGPDPEVEALAEELVSSGKGVRAAPGSAPTTPPESVRMPPEEESDDRPPTRVGGDAEPGPEIARAAVDGSAPDGMGRSGRYLVALVPLLLLALLGGMAVVWSEGTFRRAARNAAVGGADTPVDVIAVLPFSYRGTAASSYLAEGLVSLVSTSLNGAADLRSIDPYVILSQAPADEHGAAISSTRARSLARSLGADLFLLGSIVESSGRLQVTATLYDARDAAAEGISVAAAGSDVFLVVDEISRQILARKLESPGDRLARLAVLTTSSLPALKAYLEGERHFRAARYPEAVSAFRDAVDLDPDFALGHYRLSMAAEWSFSFIEARISAERALRLSESLAARDRQLVSAWYRFVVGDAAESERLFSAILADHPNDVEAWSGVGEVRLHYNPFIGRPIDEAVPAFEKVLRLAPNYGEARFHMLEFAAAGGDRAGFDSLVAGVDPQSRQALSWRAARAYAWGEDGALDDVARELAEVEEVTVGIAAARAAVHFRDLEAAERLAALLTSPARPDAWRAAGHVMAAQINLARGDWEAGAASLEAAEPIEPGWALELLAHGALLPSTPHDSERLRAIRERLEAWNPTESQPELAFFFAVHADLHVPLRLYNLALLSVRLGDEEAGRRYLAELRTSGRTNAGRDVVTALVASVNAHQAVADDDLSTALRYLEQGELRAPLERIALSPFLAQSADRFLRAEVLARLGRHEEALRWYASLSEGPDILYWASAHRRQAEVLTMLGRANEAAHHVTRLEALLPSGLAASVPVVQQ